jgi:hypothetical protein
LNKNSLAEEAGSSSGKVEPLSKSQIPLDLEEEEEHQLQHPKRNLLGFPKLSNEEILSGNTVNDILVVSSIGEVPTKNTRTNISPAVIPTKFINPHPISSALPHTK